MDFTKLDGLIPAVVQDDATNEVLMVGFMNDEAWKMTQADLATSRSSAGRASALWTKGETSGNRLAVKQIFVDCDEDTVLIKADARRRRQCLPHRRRTCFSTEVAP